MKFKFIIEGCYDVNIEEYPGCNNKTISEKEKIVFLEEVDGGLAELLSIAIETSLSIQAEELDA